MTSEKPVSVQELLDSITPDTYQRLKTAVELGKWESGEKLTRSQTEYCLQAIIGYEAMHVSERQRVGFIDTANLCTEKCEDDPDTIATDRGELSATPDRK